MKRLYFFEVLALANLAAVLLLFGRSAALAAPLLNFAALAITLGIQAIGAIAIRALVAALRRDRACLRRIASPAWLIDTVRLVLFAALMMLGYGWIKLVVPLYHGRLFDEELWQLDRLLFFGVSPAEFALHLFRDPAVLRAVDWSYGHIFFASTILAFGYFVSDPSRRVRAGFAAGNALLWISGAWLYLLLPSLGPAFRFPDVWFAHSEALQVTQGLQALLMRNYNDVLRAATGEPHGRILIVFGIGAFPSLHVGFQAFVFLWTRRLWKPGQVLFGVFLLFVFIGSLVTGWHYLVDGLAGLALAILWFSVVWRRARLSRWLRLRAKLVRR